MKGTHNHFACVSRDQHGMNIMVGLSLVWNQTLVFVFFSISVLAKICSMAMLLIVSLRMDPVVEYRGKTLKNSTENQAYGGSFEPKNFFIG